MPPPTNTLYCTHIHTPYTHTHHNATYTSGIQMTDDTRKSSHMHSIGCLLSISCSDPPTVSLSLASRVLLPLGLFISWTLFTPFPEPSLSQGPSRDICRRLTKHGKEEQLKERHASVRLGLCTPQAVQSFLSGLSTPRPVDAPWVAACS